MLHLTLILLASLSVHKLAHAAKAAESIPADVSPALSALLLECPKQKAGSKQKTPCESQLMVNIRVNPSFNTNAAEKFLILDEVYDPVRQTKVKILSPYLIQIKRSEPVIMYPLQFTKSLKVKQKATPPVERERKPAESVVSKEKQPRQNELSEESADEKPWENLDITLLSPEGVEIDRKEDWQEGAKKAYQRSSQSLTDASRPVSEQGSAANGRKLRKKRDLATQVSVPGNEEYASYYDEPLFIESESAALRNTKANTHYVPFVKKSADKKTNSLHSLAHLGLIQYVKDANTSQLDKQPNRIVKLPKKAKEDDDAKLLRHSLLPLTTAADAWRAEDVQESYSDRPLSKQKVAAKNLRYDKNLAVGRENKYKAKQKSYTQYVKSEYSVTRPPTAVEDSPDDWLSKYANHNNSSSREVFFKSKFDVDEPATSIAPQTRLQLQHMYENENEIQNDLVSDEEKNADGFDSHVPQTQLAVVKSKKNVQHQISTPFYVEKQTPPPLTESAYEWVKKPNRKEEEKHVEPTDKYMNSRYDILRLYNQKLFANRGTASDNQFLAQTMKNMIKPYPQAQHFFDKELQKYRDLDINQPPSTEKSLQKAQLKTQHLPKPKTYTQGPIADDDAELEATVMHTKPTPWSQEQKFRLGVLGGVERPTQNPLGALGADKSKKTLYQINANNFADSDTKTSQYGKKVNKWLDEADYEQQVGWEQLRKQGTMPIQKNDYENEVVTAVNNEKDLHAPAVLDERSVPDESDEYNSVGPQETAKHLAKSSGYSAALNVDDDHDFGDKELDMSALNNRHAPTHSLAGDKHIVGDFPVFKYGPNKKHQILIKPYRYYESLEPKLPKITTPKLSVKKAPSYLDFVKPSQLETANLADKSKRKRSYLIYDDLESEDARDVSDYSTSRPSAGKLTARVALGARSEDAQPCDSCGGKNKKPPPGKPSLSSPDNVNSFAVLERRAEDLPCDSCGGKNKKVGGKPGRDSFGNVCDCRKNPTACNCEGSKLSRSVPVSSYSVFNMSVPLPFLTTKLRIFRKRQKTWWRIIPEVTLNTLSGIFANGDLSVLFSSHVDILQLEKSMCLQNHQLLIPSKDKSARQAGAKEVEFNTLTLSANPSDIFATDSTQIDFSLLNELSGSIKDEMAKDQPFSEDFAVWNKLQDQFTQSRMSSKSGVTPIADLGFFPTSMNALERCPNDNERLCLNMLDERVPAYTMKLKMPFRENVAIRPNVLKVKISRIITDATTKDALQVSVDVINKGFEARQFSISVQDCPLPNAEPMQTAVEKLLLPYIAETVTFLLPFILQPKSSHKRFSCNVVVSCTPVDVPSGGGKTKRAAKNQTVVVAIREMDVEPQARCFCIWKCKCHCMSKLESHVDFNVCEKMSSGTERDAGLLLNCPPGDDSEDVCLLDRNLSIKKLADDWGFCQIMTYVLQVILALLLLGLIKALLGLCCSRINRCGYGSVQPRGSYDAATRCRRFVVNLLFFLMLPFLCWCQCLTPSHEDLKVASSEWLGKQKQANCSSVDDDDEDEIIYSRRREEARRKKRLFAGEDNYNTPGNELPLPYVQSWFSDDDEDGNTTFILQALEESRQSLERMVNSMSSAKSKDVDQGLEDDTKHKAEEFVRQLKSARIVYRTLNEAKQVLQNVPDNVKYCIQGFFLPSDMDYYEYISPNPLTQYIGIAADGHTVEALHPALQIDPGSAFSRKYDNKLQVYAAADLSVLPPQGVPCINGSNFNTLESSLDKLTALQQSRLRLDTTSEEEVFNVKSIPALAILDKSSECEGKPQLRLNKTESTEQSEASSFT